MNSRRAFIGGIIGASGALVLGSLSSKAGAHVQITTRVDGVDFTSPHRCSCNRAGHVLPRRIICGTCYVLHMAGNNLELESRWGSIALTPGRDGRPRTMARWFKCSRCDEDVANSTEAVNAHVCSAVLRRQNDQ